MVFKNAKALKLAALFNSLEEYDKEIVVSMTEALVKKCKKDAIHEGWDTADAICVRKNAHTELLNARGKGMPPPGGFKLNQQGLHPCGNNIMNIRSKE